MANNLLEELLASCNEYEKRVINEVIDPKPWDFMQLGLEREPVLVGMFAEEILEQKLETNSQDECQINPPNWISLTDKNTIYLKHRLSVGGILIKTPQYKDFRVPIELWRDFSLGIVHLLQLELDLNANINEANVKLTIREGIDSGYSRVIHTDGVKYQNRLVGHQLIVSNTGQTSCCRYVEIKNEEVQRKFRSKPDSIEMKNKQQEQLTQYIQKNSKGPVKKTEPFGIYLTTENLPHCRPGYCEPRWRSFWRLSVEYRKHCF